MSGDAAVFRGRVELGSELWQWRITRLDQAGNVLMAEVHSEHAAWSLCARKLVRADYWSIVSSVMQSAPLLLFGFAALKKSRAIGSQLRSNALKRKTR